MSQPEIVEAARKFAAAMEQAIHQDHSTLTGQRATYQLGFKIVRACFDQPFTIAVTRIHDEDVRFGLPPIDGHFVIRLGDYALPVDALLSELSTNQTGGTLEYQEREGQRWWIHVRERESFRIGRIDDFFVFVCGEPARNDFDIPAQPTRPQWLAEIWQDLSVPRVGTVSYFHAKQVLEVLGGEFNEATAVDFPWFRSDDLLSIAGTTGLDEQGFVGYWSIRLDQAHRSDRKETPFEPIQSSVLAEIPQDVTGFMATRVSPKLIVDWVRSVGAYSMRFDVDAFDDFGEWIEPNRKWLDDFLGLEVDTELTPTLGDLAFIYGQVSIFAPTSGWMVALQIEDSMSFPAILEQMNLKIGRCARDQGFEFSESQTGQQTVYTLAVPSFVLPSETICWCYAHDYLYVSMDKGTIAKHLRTRGRPESIRDLATVERVFADGKKLELSDPISMVQMDTAAIVNLIVPFVQMLPGMDEGLLGDEFSLRDLPSVDVLTQGVQPSTLAIYNAPDGLRVVQRQTMPGTSPMIVLAFGMVSMVPMQIEMEHQMAHWESANNMRMLAIGMHNYHDAYRAFPAAANIDEQKQPLLSWRVHLLPFLDEQELYEQFRLDEPWDSDHNRSLIERMPRVFMHPTMPIEMGRTPYLAVVGEDAAVTFPGDARVPPRGVRIQDIHDGTSNTALVVEVNAEHAVVWTQPSDFDSQFDGELLQRLQGVWPDGRIQIVLADGSLWSGNHLTERMLRMVMTRSGGEDIDLWDHVPRAEMMQEMIID
ncbi:MAG TPA: DUF1559 domain-containing protein [Pirellulaceae bacterium]|nr:DUF1559 domain-containing protein [Pirellulaceae bacterium]